MTRKSTPLDIYFHMANHYRKLQSVKSVVDTSAPIGYYEKLQGARQSRPPSRAEKHRECACLDRSYDRSKFNVTKHDYLSKEANPPSRSQSLPPRPPTRRKLSDMPTPRRGQYLSRARSSGPSSRRDSAQKSRSTRSQRSPKFTPPVFAHFTASMKPNPTQEADHKEVNEKSPTPAPRNVKLKQRDTTFKNSITDHEYLQFSLRITEDIIRNDLYTNQEMRRVFNSHLEANRGRLDMEKMSQQVDNLCKELNIPLSETQDDALNTRSQTKSPRLAKKNNPSCICGPKSGPFAVELKNCECASTRCLPLQCIQHSVSKIEKLNNNGITCITSVNTTPNSQGTGKDKAEEEEIESTSEIEVYENPHNVSMTPLSLSEYFVTQREESNDSDNIPYYNECDDVAPIRQSLGFLELPLLPSLSRVTEKTEPTTSCDTMNAKSVISEPNTESGLTFEASDVLPVCEQLEQEDKECFTGSITESLHKKRNTNFEKYRLMKMQPDSPSQGSEQNTEDYLISLQPDNTSLRESHHSQAKSKVTNLVQQAPSSAADGENVYWLICPNNRTEQTTSVAHTCLHSKEEKLSSAGILPSASIKSAPVSEPHNMKTVCGVSSTYYSQPTGVGFTAQQTISETRSEPIKQCKMPVPAPRSCSHSSSPSSEIKCVDLTVASAGIRQNTVSKSTKNDGVCNCDKENCKYQTTQLLEASNIKICGLNNQEQEYVLVSGPIYIPKSSIIPIQSENSQNIRPPPPETAKRNICTSSKDAMVNTDEQWSARSNTNNTKNTQSSTSSKFTVIKEPSFLSNVSSYNYSVISPQSTTNNSCILKPAEESDSTTYSHMHKLALNTTHFTSFASNISGMHDLLVPYSHPISESFLQSDEVQTNISKPPKMLLNRTSPSILSSGTEGNVLTHLNDYDLTPQRDSNRSAYSNNTMAESQQFSFKDQFTLFNKDALLLGDEYEIKDEFGSKKSSISSCYDNGLPHSICRFYPNISTQTRSSDFLLPTVPLAKLKTSEITQLQKPALPKTEPINKEVIQEPQDKKSILKKKLPPSKQLETKQAESNHPNLEDQEPVKQNKLKKEESDKELELLTRLENLLELNSSDSSEEKSVSFDEFSSDKEDLSGSLQVDNDEEMFEKESEDHEMKFDDNEDEEETIEAEEKEENEGKNENDINKDKNNVENDEEEDILEGLDRPPASYAHRPSMMLTIKQVTTQLEKFRKTEIPVDEFVQSRYNVPKKSQAFEVADDLQQKQAQSLVKEESNTSIFSTMTNTSYRGSSASRLPFIEITNSETQLQVKGENSSSEIENSLCCGLKRGKKKGRRRDVVNVDESSHKIPNISSIPDDQLFEMKPRRPTVESGYGNDRKSLRFDYSAMGQFSGNVAEEDIDCLRRETLDIKDFTSNYSAELSISKVPHIESSTEIIPVLRNPVVSYRTPSSSQQPKYDDASATSPLPLYQNVATANNDEHNSVVIILPPQDESMASIQVIEPPENENVQTSEPDTNNGTQSEIS